MRDDWNWKDRIPHLAECPLCASSHNDVRVIRYAPFDFEGYGVCLNCGAEIHGAMHGRDEEEAGLYAAILWNAREVRECVYAPVRNEAGRKIGQKCAVCGYQSTVEIERDDFVYCPGCASLIVQRDWDEPEFE